LLDEFENKSCSQGSEGKTGWGAKEGHKQKAELAGLTIALGGVSADAARLLLPGEFLPATGDAADLYYQEWLAQGLASAADRLPAGEAALLLTQAMKKTNAPYAALGPLAQVLARVAVRLPPDEATRHCTAAISLLTQVLDTRLAYPQQPNQELLARGLAAVADCVPARQAAPLLIQAMGKATSAVARALEAQTLAAVLVRLPADESAQYCNEAAVILRHARRWTPGHDRPTLAPGIAAVGARLPPREAVALLTEAMREDAHRGGFDAPAQALATVLDRLPARQAAALITAADDKSTDWATMAPFLARVANRLPSNEALVLCRQVVARLMADIETDDFAVLDETLRWRARGLAAVAASLTREEAARHCAMLGELLTKAMERSKERHDGEYLVKDYAIALAAVAAYLPPDQATRQCGAAAAVLTPYLRSTDRVGQETLDMEAVALALVVDRMPATEAATLLSRAMDRDAFPEALDRLAQILADVTARLPADEAARHCSAAAKVLIQAIGKGKFLDAHLFQQPHPLARALGAVCARIPAREAARLLDAVMGEGTGPLGLAELAPVLAAVAARLPADEAARRCSAVALRLSPAKDPADAETLGFGPGSLSWAQGLAAVSARLPADDAARHCSAAAALLTRAIATSAKSRRSEYEYSYDYQLAHGLVAVAAWLPVDEAARHYRAAGASFLWKLQNVVPPLPGPFPPPDRRWQTANGLTTVLTRLPAPEAVALLNEALNTPRDPDTVGDVARGYLARGLAEVATRLPADQVAALLMQMHGDKTPADLGPLTQNLIARLSPQQVESRQRAVAAGVGLLAIPSRLLNPPAPLLAAAEPLPTPLAAPLLVNVLKSPVCAGPTRRAVLDQLERHYQSTFADQWDFVRFAGERGLGLDLTSPPARQRVREH
jgi:hypothetical protein